MSVGINLNGDYTKNTWLSNTTPSYEYDNWEWELVANPYFQYFVKDNLALGVGLNYSIDQTIGYGKPLTASGFPTKDRVTSHLFGFELFVTKYWFVGPKSALYLQPKLSSVYYLYSVYNKTENPSYTDAENETQSLSDAMMYKANLNLGFQYFISPNFALQAQIEIAQYLYMQDYQTGGFLKKQPYFMFGVNYFFTKTGLKG
jgi:hypothetical protein